MAKVITIHKLNVPIQCSFLIQIVLVALYFFSDAAGSFPFNRQMIYGTANKQQNINNKYQVKTQWSRGMNVFFFILDMNRAFMFPKNVKCTVQFFLFQFLADSHCLFRKKNFLLLQWHNGLLFKYYKYVFIPWIFCFGF